jgi:ABC-type phosphate transport system substrate-binding protein
MRKKTSSRARLLAFVGVLVWWAFPAIADPPKPSFLVIVHKSNPVTSMSRSDLERIFLKKESRWSEDRPADPVDQTATSPVRAEFSRLVLRKSTDAVVSYWQQRIFSGRGVPPGLRALEAEIVDHVAKSPGGVAYVSAAANLKDTKVVVVVFE